MSELLREGKPLIAAGGSATDAGWRGGSQAARRKRRDQGANPIFDLSPVNSVYSFRFKSGLLASGHRHDLLLRGTTPCSFQQFGEHLRIPADLEHILPG